MKKIKRYKRDYIDNSGNPYDFILNVLFAFFIIIMVIGLSAIVISEYIENKKQDQNWNDGICVMCGGKYELYAINRNYYYVCESCGHICESSKPRR